MSYYAARSLMGTSSSIVSATSGLVGEINERYPNRDHASDGWIGDASHSARASDHNPDYNDGGIVRAVDIDNNGEPNELTQLVKDVLNAAIGDPRVYYVIYARKIYSRTHGWEARYYSGTNPHDHHVHVSVLDGALENNTATWLTDPLPKIQGAPVSLSEVREQFLATADHDRPLSFSNSVGRIQQVLNRQYGADLTVDGVAGPATLEAWARFERTIKSQGRLQVPDRKTLPVFAHGRFRLVA